MSQARDTGAWGEGKNNGDGEEKLDSGYMLR